MLVPWQNILFVGIFLAKKYGRPGGQWSVAADSQQAVAGGQWTVADSQRAAVGGR